MGKIFAGIVVIILLLGAYILIQRSSAPEEVTTLMDEEREKLTEPKTLPVEVIPISHATAVLKWGETVIYTDPVGGAKAFEGQPAPDIILVTDIHGDHLNAETLTAVLGDAILIVPEAVKKMLPAALAARARVMKNGDRANEKGIDVLAIPMYNLPETKESRHIKGRGNGYVLEYAGYRVYVAGDTAGIPEMRALEDIGVALIPMNLPYTMSVDEAAEAVLAFAPEHVSPYHYRGPDGLADVNRFKELVNAGNPAIEVMLLNWYPTP